MGSKNVICLLSIFTLVVTAFASLGQASIPPLKRQYKVATELIINGQTVSSPSFIVIADEPAAMEMKAEGPIASVMKMSLTASDAAMVDIPGGIHLKMALNFKSEGHTIRADPQMVVKPGEDGLITLKDQNGETVALKVKATRQ